MAFNVDFRQFINILSRYNSCVLTRLSHSLSLSIFIFVNDKVFLQTHRHTKKLKCKKSSWFGRFRTHAIYTLMYKRYVRQQQQRRRQHCRLILCQIYTAQRAHTHTVFAHFLFFTIHNQYTPNGRIRIIQ